MVGSLQSLDVLAITHLGHENLLGKFSFLRLLSEGMSIVNIPYWYGMSDVSVFDSSLPPPLLLNDYCIGIGIG